MVFSAYASFYDVYYADKDYSTEVDFVLALAEKFGSKPKSVLDMGCGTGRHLVQFIKRGLNADGFDQSGEMLAQARQRLNGTGVRLSKGSLVDFRSSAKYDLVVAMFAVMGYLTTNEKLLAGFRTAREHLLPGGVFVFDTWFGPAVLAQKPEPRRHQYQEGDRTIIREVAPSLDAVDQVVTVRYRVTEMSNGVAERVIEEEHGMRFMFVQETKLALAMSGLELVHCCPFLDAGGAISTDTWNIAFVARRRS